MPKLPKNPFLTSEEIMTLNLSGHSHDDIAEIEHAIKKTSYHIILTDGTRKPLQRDEAISILGREEWVRGIARSAFYVNTVRTADSGERISFHSRVYR